MTFEASRVAESSLPSWLTFNLLTFTFSGTPEGDSLVNTSTEIQITASDGYSSANVKFKITITNASPVLAKPLRTQFSEQIDLGLIQQKPYKLFQFDLSILTFTDPGTSCMAFAE